MSTPLVDLLSRPESAHVRPSENRAMEATGCRPAPRPSGKYLKNRRQSRLMFDIIRQPSESPEDHVFAHFQREAERKEGANCVFLLWGSENSGTFTTWAVDVPITDLESEDKIFTLLAEKYATERGFLQRCLCFRKFGRLKPVTFRLISRYLKRFIVFMEPLDLANYHNNYSERREKAMANIASITNFESIRSQDYCYRDSSGNYEHYNSECATHLPFDLDSLVCPFEELHLCNSQLRWIETAPFLTCYFRNPAGARSQTILNGFIMHRFTHHYRDIHLPLNDISQQNRYFKLNGLYVETVWSISKGVYVFTGLLLCLVVGGNLIFGSWEITFGAGSFMVALPMLALTVLSYYRS